MTTVTPPWTDSVAGTGTAGLQTYPLFLLNRCDGSNFDQNPTLRIDRDVETDPASPNQGTPWYTYKALWVNTWTGRNSPGFEWAITGELHNRSRKSTNAQHVAVNGTAWKEKTDNGEETSTTWAGNFNVVDETGVSDPTTSCIALELDIGGVVGTDKNRQRILSHAAGGGQQGSHIAYGYMVSTGSGVTIDRAFSCANVGSTFGIGLDLAGASFTGAAVLMAPEQWLALDGDANGNFGHFLGFHNGRFIYMTPYGPMLQFSDDGAAYVGRVIANIPHVPSSITSPGEPGEQAWDQNYFYICIAANRWRRVKLSDW